MVLERRKSKSQDVSSSLGVFIFRGVVFWTARARERVCGRAHRLLLVSRLLSDNTDVNTLGTLEVLMLECISSSSNTDFFEINQ